MDELAAFNRERWNALVDAGVEYSQPLLDLMPETARERVDKEYLLGEVRGKRVLCLASGGGQQSACFALLGADVTVLDLSDKQLAHDRKAAQHYGLSIRIEQGDMRDLSRFDANSFDLVYQGYSINFVPDPRQVFAQVARVLKPDSAYFVQCSNPHRFSALEGKWHEGIGYGLVQKYADGEVTWQEPHWEFEREDGVTVRMPAPREFNHTWRTMIDGLAEHGFAIRHCREWMRTDEDAEPGSWVHYTQVMPQYVTFVTKLTKLMTKSASDV